MKGRFWVRHNTFWTLLPPMSKFKFFTGPRYFVQTYWYLLSPAAIQFQIIIDLKQFVIKLTQWCWWKFNQFVFENLIEGIVFIMIHRRLFWSNESFFNCWNIAVWKYGGNKMSAKICEINNFEYLQILIYTEILLKISKNIYTAQLVISSSIQSSKSKHHQPNFKSKC